MNIKANGCVEGGRPNRGRQVQMNYVKDDLAKKAVNSDITDDIANVD